MVLSWRVARPVARYGWDNLSTAVTLSLVVGTTWGYGPVPWKRVLTSVGRGAVL